MSLNSALIARFGTIIMSFYIKLGILICVGSMVAWFAIQGLVLSTDHLPDRFSASNTNYSKSEESADKDATGIETFDEIVDEKTALEKQKRSMAEKSLDQNEILAEDNAGGSNQATRSDSDADMQVNSINKTAVNSEPGETRSDKQLVRNKINKADKKPVAIRKSEKIVQALDVAYAPPNDTKCSNPTNEIIKVGVNYRATSYAIKGHSLTNIDKLIQLYNECGGGKLLVLQNAEGLGDTEERLIQQRKDEVKYYLLQRRVPKDDMIFPDNL